MCQLLGMNCNVPTDICFSFSGFHHRGGRTDEHADGWGIAFYEGPAMRVVFLKGDRDILGDLRDYAQALTRHANGYMTHAVRQESPSRLSAAVNARHLEEVPERDLGHLADQMMREDAVEVPLRDVRHQGAVHPGTHAVTERAFFLGEERLGVHQVELLEGRQRLGVDRGQRLHAMVP